jgi:hypothetical protein
LAECGKLVISLDTEIAWGRISDPKRTEFYGLFEDARSIIERMLDMFEQYEIPVTWALVGRLIENSENPTRYLSDNLSDYFPGIDSESVYNNADLNSDSNSFVHFAEVVALIRNYSTPHELGSHSYNHCFFDEVTDKNLIERDFLAMQSVTMQYGFNASSLVFPKNQVNHLEVVASNGIQIYRSEDVYWYDKYSRSGWLRKLLRQLDLLTPIAASNVQLETDQYGVCSLPGSIVFRREHRGLKRLLPFGLLSSKSIRALNNCVKTGNYVHLWWHPFNFAYKPEQHFKHLEKVLVHASGLREKGKLEVLTMGAAETKYRPAIEVA